MIAVIIGIIVCFAFAFEAFYLNKRYMKTRAVLYLMGIAALITGIMFYPLCNVWQAEMSARADAIEYHGCTPYGKD